MNKSNSIMEKIQEYQAPKCDVMELQNEGAILTVSGVTPPHFGSGGTIGSTTTTEASGLNWTE